MSTSKGSKIALAVAGLILIAGAATAIAMTQSKDSNSLPVFGTEDSSNVTGAIKIPKVPAPDAEVGEVPFKSDPMADSETDAEAYEDGSAVPGMNKLFKNEGMTTDETNTDPTQKTE
ncbi:MAG: hypothetical protein KTR23_02750 [Rhodospirillales bacterium]|nr:hypothetical protein [Rhodospirillales bacterium]